MSGNDSVAPLSPPAPQQWNYLVAPDAGQIITPPDAAAVASPPLLMHSAERVDLQRWWQQLNDPLLSELVGAALQASPELRSAESRLRAARARHAQAVAGYYPQLTATGSAARSWSSEQSGSGERRDLYRAGFDAGWELDIFGGVRRSVEAAKADVDAVAAELHSHQVSLVAEVAATYIELRALQLRLAIAGNNLLRQSETLQLSEWREQAGLVSGQDVAQARSSREQTRAQLPALHSSLVAAEHRLDILLGELPGRWHERLAVAVDLPQLPEAVVIAVPVETLRQRPDVRRAERLLAAETARVGVAQAARYPAFNLSAALGVEALTLGALDSGSAASSSLLAALSAPIFDAGKLRRQVNIQTEVREQALLAYQQALLTAVQDVENALVHLHRSGERRAALSVATQAAQSAAQLSRQRYSAGVTDFQAVLDSERTLLVVEDSLADSRAERVLALIQLYKALGGGWAHPAERSEPVSAGKDKS